MSTYSNVLEKLNFHFILGNLQIKVISLNIVPPDPSWQVPDHMHSAFEFHIIPEGKGYITLEGRAFEVNKGEFYITGPMICHRQTSDSENPMSEYCLECEIKVLQVSEKESSFMEDEGKFLKAVLSGPYPHAFKDVSNIRHSFEAILTEAEQQKAGYLIKIQLLLFDLIVSIFRTVCESENILYDYPSVRNTFDAVRIQKLVKYIHENVRNPITLLDASKVVLLSPRQIDRLMKKNFSQTFHKYLQTYRLFVAEKLLTNTDLSIEEVAYEAGFSSHYYMYQAFKIRGHEPPGLFRINRREHDTI